MKYTLEEIKKFPPKLFFKLIRRMKDFLKKDPRVIEMFHEYGVSIDEIDFYPMCFADIDVSARTDHGVIYFNYRLLCDGDFFRDFSYGVHEICHVLQQTASEGPTTTNAGEHYLDNPYEIEGFQNQVAWLHDQFGEKHAQDYVDEMLEYHEFEGKEKREKAEELMEEV